MPIYPRVYLYWNLSLHVDFDVAALELAKEKLGDFSKEGQMINYDKLTDKLHYTYMYNVCI